MIRKTLYLTLAVAFVLTLGTPIVNACGDDAKCDVDRTCEKSETGVRCTIIAKGETTADQVRECVRKCAGSAEHCDKVTVTFEDVDGGIAVVKTSSDEAAVKALHAKADGCAKAAKDGKGCCSKAHAAKTAEGTDCPHAKADSHEDCPHAKTGDHTDCPHSAEKTTVNSSGCNKAKTADDA